MTTSRTCSCCGEEVTGLPLDYNHTLPDSLLNLSKWQRYRVSQPHKGLISYKNTDFFVRGLMSLPVLEIDDSLRFGSWVRISKADYKRYLEFWTKDKGYIKETVYGELDNSIRALSYPNVIGLKVAIIDHQTDTPQLILDPVEHPLYLDQKNSISQDKVHEVAQRMGY